MFTAQGPYASSSSDGVSATSPSTHARQSNWCTSTAVMRAWQLVALAPFDDEAELDADVPQLVGD